MKRPWLQHYGPVPAKLNYPEKTLGNLLIKTAKTHPEYIATTMNEVDITYGEINKKVNGLAHAFVSLGIRPGDRVALILPNSPTYVIAFYALMKIGAIVANINVTSHGEELVGFLNLGEVRLAVTLDLFLQNVLNAAPKSGLEKILIHSVFGLEKKAKIPDGVPAPLLVNELIEASPKEEPGHKVSPDQVAVLQFTSGTTGLPKAATLTHRNIVANLVQNEAWLHHPPDSNGGVICIIPFFHVFGMTANLHVSVYKGHRMILVPMFDVLSVLPLIKLIEKYKPMAFAGVPALWAAMVMHPELDADILSSIKLPTSGGAPLPSWVQELFQKITGRRILEAYGLSEAAAATHFTPYPQGADPGSLGLPMPDTDAKIMDMENGTTELPIGQIGELTIRGPQIMSGYWKSSEQTKASLRDGWLYTGDLARMDEAGYFYLVDRKDDLIITSGFNVYPSEIEKVLMEYRGIKDAAVIGVEDKIRGQTVAAFIVPNEGVSLDKSEIKEHCLGQLPDYKTPRRFVFCDEIPRNPIGKPLRKLLRAKT